MDVVTAIEALPVGRFHRLHLLRQMLAWSVFAMSRMRRPRPNRLARCCLTLALTLTLTLYSLNRKELHLLNERFFLFWDRFWTL